MKWLGEVEKHPKNPEEPGETVLYLHHGCYHILDHKYWNSLYWRLGETIRDLILFREETEEIYLKGKPYKIVIEEDPGDLAAKIPSEEWETLNALSCKIRKIMEILDSRPDWVEPVFKDHQSAWMGL